MVRSVVSVGFSALMFLYAATGIAQVSVGVAAPLTGDLAEYGAAVRNGITLAIEKQPKAFEQIHFLYEDNQYDAAKTVAAVRKLTTVNRVNVLYNWGEAPLHAIAPIVEQMKLPTIAMSIDPAPAQGKKYVIRSVNDPKDYVAISLEFLRAKGYRNIGIALVEDPFVQSLVDALKAQLSPSEKMTVVFTVASTNMDFKTQISKIRSGGFDVLGVYLMSGQVGNFYKQAASQGVKLPSFGTDVFESKTEIGLAGGAMEGSVYPNIKIPEWFYQEYVSRFKNDTQIAYAYNAFHFGTLTAKVFSGGAVGDGEQILKGYLDPQVKNIPVKLHSDAQSRYYEFPLELKEVKGGTFVAAGK